MKRITGRSWAFVMYPDSLPDDWQEIITDTGLPMCVSPLHDRDLNPTGEEKKPHYHVICYYENATTLNNVKTNVCDKLHATIPIKLESMRGMYRYHIHLDNPEKFQYDDRDRMFFNGFDVDFASKLTHTETLKLINDIQFLIRDNFITEFSDLLDFLQDNDLTQMRDITISYSSFFKYYLDSKRNKLKDTKKYLT